NCCRTPSRSRSRALTLRLPMTEIIETAAQAIQARAGAARLDVAIVLGTGLGSTVESLVAEPIAIPYSEIPGFPTVSVPGHAGRLVIGGAEGLRVACLAGRQHYYERG